LLNRNPFDQDRAALGKTGEEARDERGLRLLHRVRSPRGLTSEQVRRIASRLDATVLPVRRRSLLPVLAAVALLLSAGTAAAWATGTLPRLPVVGALFTRPPNVPRSPAVAMARAPIRPLEVAAPKEQAPPASVPDEIGGLEGTEGSQPRRREGGPASLAPAGRRRASPSPAPPATRPRPTAPQEPPTVPSTVPGTTPLAVDSPIARESESFANVLRSWRRDHDDRTAMSALDLHDRLFASGQMALESRLLRVEILLSRGSNREALALLDRLSLGKGNVPRGPELLTVRGELRIKAGRCDDGRADLASIAAGSDGLAQRARNALTHCQ